MHRSFSLSMVAGVSMFLAACAGAPVGNGGQSDAGSNIPGSSSSPGAAPAPHASCTAPAFTTSDPSGGWSTEGYYVHNNMWNSAAGPEALHACAYNNWYVVSRQVDNAGAVKTYPNVHRDYNGAPAIRSFSAITSTFSEESPHVGIYDVAYDIWLNGIASPGSTEIMIWTENYKQVPAGDKLKTAILGGRTYDVWRTTDGQYLAFVPQTPFTSGTMDLLELFNWTMAQGWLSQTSTVGQIDFGVEIVSTDGADATFTFNDFSITSN